jgi:hypothetical protein
MQSKANTIEDYFASLPEDRREVMQKLHHVIASNLDSNFLSGMSYGMIGYAVPHSVYPNGYHCDPKQPLPFMGLASQKNFIALYHMAVYAKKDLYDWFVSEYPKHCKTKLDMGKSCIRFKKMDDIPFDLIAELTHKVTAYEWIDIYESQLKKQ